MDNITHAALGAAVGELMLGKNLGNRALLWGALFANLPDFDGFISLFLDSARTLAFHRGPTHSLLFAAVLSFAISPWLAKLWKKQKITKGRAGTFVFAAILSHLLIDCFSTYGTSVLWPFPAKRIAFGNLFIIDLFFTIPLVVTVIWLAFLRTKKQAPKRRRLCLWGLGLSGGYVVLSLLAKWTASTGFDADLARRKVSFARRMEAPTPFNILLWRSVVDRGDEFWVGYRTIFEFHSTPVRWTIYPKNSEALLPYAEAREVETVMDFSDRWCIARPHAKGVWLADMRFGEIRTWGEKKGMLDNRIEFSWVFTPGDSGDKLRQIHPDHGNAGEIMKRMVRRIFGDRENWEGPPRLAGIHGSLPELLRTEE